MKKQLLLIAVSILLLTACNKEKIEITDIDGNEYHGVTIGSQIWMTENLRTTRYADGSAIPNVEDNTAWSELEVDDKAYCWYDNSSSEMEVYGGLYYFLKEEGNLHWGGGNWGASNLSGFTALPGGRRDLDGTFDALTFGAYFWTSTEITESSAYRSALGTGSGDVNIGGAQMNTGRSVRCVKD